MNSQVWWFVARSSGIIAWALLSLGVCWGLWLSTKVASARARSARTGTRRTVRATPAWVLALHRHLGGLAVIFTLIHLVGLVADSYVHFGWTEILVPMASEWEPGAVAFGVVGLYLLLAIEATSLAMRFLPRQVWRWIHRSSFVLYATATYHGIAAGTDAGNAWFRVAAWTSVVAVVALTLRLLLVLRRAERVDVGRERDEAPVAAPTAPASSPWPPPVVTAVPSSAQRPGHPLRPPLVPSGVPATAPVVELPSPAEWADEGVVVSAGGGAGDAPGRPTAGT